MLQAEVNQFATKIQKAYPHEEVRVVHGGSIGTGIFAAKSV